MSRKAKLYLNDILVCIKRIEEYTAHLSFEELSTDQKTIDAVIRNFEIISEAIKNLSPEIKSKYDYDWRSVAGLRDIFIHGYFVMSLKIIWDIVQNEIPELENNVREIVEGEGFGVKRD